MYSILILNLKADKVNSTPHSLKERIDEASLKYSSTLDKLIEGCSIIDYNWNFLYVNDVQAQHAYKPRSEMIGRTIFEMVPGIEGSSFFEALQHTMQERVPQSIENSFKFEDGREGWYQVHSIPVPEGIFVQTLDITVRKKMEEELSTATGRFVTLGDNISQLAWMADSTGWLYWYNKRWYDYTGTNFRQMEGWGWKEVQHPEHLDRVVKKFTDSIKSGEPWEDTFPLRSRTGEYRWFLSRALPVRDDSGRIVRWFGTNTDITERMDAEKRLEEAYKKIEIQLREKDVLLKELHHRTKNNMQIISSLLGLKAEAIQDEKLLEIITDIKTRIRTMALVHEKLYKTGDLSRINLSEYIRELTELIAQSYLDHSGKIKLEFKLDEAEALIDKAIPAGLILTELVTNAFKHAFPGTRGGLIEIILTTIDGKLQLSVKDDGIGFNKEEKMKEGKLGLQLFESISESQLNARVMLDQSEGVKWTIIFNNADGTARV